MELFISLLTSGNIKWISIFLIFLGISGGLYFKHRQIVDQEKQIALQQYNIRQLEQNLKDKEKFISDLDKISKNKDEAINLLEKQRQTLDNKLKEVDSEIDLEVGKGNDRPSSNILKETIKRLSQ